MSQIQNKTFERKVGETVILPCLVQMNITHERVEWFKGPKTSENDQPIHKCIWRPKATQTQSDDFKNLTSLFEEELSSGNVSLSLKLNTSHSDTYYCYVGGRLYCTVTIKGTCLESYYFIIVRFLTEMYTRCFTGYKQSLSQLHDNKSDV